MPLLIIVSCGSRKIWNKNPEIGPTRASDAYVGAPFKLNRKYAEKFGDHWVILSAKYGFIEPSFIIPANYNVTFKKPSTNSISISQLREQVKRKQLNKFDEVTVLGGSDYADIIKKVFEEFPVKIKAPVAGLPIGIAMAKVRGRLDENKPF
ncbi:MAG: DUF6884 domain-containing protein [Candidatus Hecatellaceae archaeon]|nr:MAG: hypothetical protein DRO43_02670 [Candidatus Hecatellales archaeon]